MGQAKLLDSRVVRHVLLSHKYHRPRKPHEHPDLQNFLELQGVLAPSHLQSHYGNGVFGNVYLLALDNTKQVNIAGTPLP